jgi:hypothetical protein
MFRLNLEEIEGLEAKAEIWREEEHESMQYKSFVELAKKALNRNKKNPTE